MNTDSGILIFHGVDEYDVYNTSIPFEYNGNTYLFGRVEKREEWATSHVRLFQRVNKDEYELVEGSMIYPLEDPCIAYVCGEYVLCGTHVQKINGTVSIYYAYFYRGSDPLNLKYFTTGPANMKDIRLVQMLDGRIGVFSRPRGPEIEALHGSGSIVGFTTIASLDELHPDIIANAKKIDGLFDNGEWGGSNQAYMLSDETIGIIGHKSREEVDQDGIAQKIYDNIAFRFCPKTHTLLDLKTIATRSRFLPSPCKVPDLKSCAFASGIVAREDNMVDLYSGIGDVCEGRIAINNPFGMEWID